MASLGALGRALSNRDARLFFSASLISWTGLWVHKIGIGWLVWEMTHRALWVGLMAFCDLGPAVLFSSRTSRYTAPCATAPTWSISAGMAGSS